MTLTASLEVSPEVCPTRFGNRSWCSSGPTSRISTGESTNAKFVISFRSGCTRTYSARWGMYAVTRNRLAYEAISHPPWPLHGAQLLELDDSLVTAAGYRSASGEPDVMWSPGVNVAIGRLRRVGQHIETDTEAAP